MTFNEVTNASTILQKPVVLFEILIFKVFYVSAFSALWLTLSHFLLVMINNQSVVKNCGLIKILKVLKKNTVIEC